MKTKYYCIDCHKEIKWKPSHPSKRCFDCYQKSRNKHLCKDCGIETTTGSKLGRCKSCARYQTYSSRSRN